MTGRNPWEGDDAFQPEAGGVLSLFRGPNLPFTLLIAIAAAGLISFMFLVENPFAPQTTAAPTTTIEPATTTTQSAVSPSTVPPDTTPPGPATPGAPSAPDAAVPDGSDAGTGGETAVDAEELDELPRTGGNTQLGVLGLLLLVAGLGALTIERLLRRTAS